MELFTFKITVHMPILHCSWDMNSARGAKLKKKKKKGKRKRIQTKLKYKNLCIFYEYFDIEYTDHMLLVICEERCPHNKKICTLNIQNFVHSLKIYVH